jgi:hypothetical protein
LRARLFADVLGDLLVEQFLAGAQFVLGGVAAALRGELLAFKGVEVFLHQPVHQVGGVAAVNGVLLLAGKAVLIQQSHEGLEVFVLAFVRRGRHQQQVAGMVPDPLAHLVAHGGGLELPTEVVGAHAVGFIADHQVPLRCLLKPGLQLLVAGEHVHAGDQQGLLGKWIAQPCGIDQVAGEQLKLQLKFLLEFVLPLLRQGTRCHDQAPFQLPADQLLLDQQAGHDRFARPWVVSQQLAHGLAREHVLVDRADLVGQRVDAAAAHRHKGVEQVGQPDPFAL